MGVADPGCAYSDNQEIGRRFVVFLDDQVGDVQDEIDRPFLEIKHKPMKNDIFIGS
jgi:hypothetical protein